MADREDRGRRGGRAPRFGLLGKLVVLAAVVVAGGGGYLAWRYHRRTGEIDLDGERWRTVVTDEVEDAKAGIRKAKRVITDASLKTVACSRELLAAVETWLRERRVPPASREELEDTREAYARELGGSPPPAEPAGGGAADAGPAPASPEPAAAPKRVATGAAADALLLGREEFKTGLEHWRAAGEPGSPREQEELAIARERFTSAQEHLTRAEKDAPDDPEIQKLLVDTNRFLYDCLKRQKVDVRG